MAKKNPCAKKNPVEKGSVRKAKIAQKNDEAKIHMTSVFRVFR